MKTPPKKTAPQKRRTSNPRRKSYDTHSEKELTSKLARASQVATIIATLVTAIAISFGYFQFKETIELEKESKVIELYIKYNEMMEKTTDPPPPNDETHQFWQNNLAIVIAETIFRFRGNDKGWRTTVGTMISRHSDFISEQKLDCETYDPKFINFAKQTLDEDICNREK